MNVSLKEKQKMKENKQNKEYFRNVKCDRKIKTLEIENKRCYIIALEIAQQPALI